MIRSIIKDPLRLTQIAQIATSDDQAVGQDLVDTLLAHRDECVGMAANMIGINKSIIVFIDLGKPVLMYNPEIIKTSATKKRMTEGCISHPGKTFEVMRYDAIKVSYQDASFKKKIKTYKGFTAEVIQHEMDHLQGILV